MNLKKISTSFLVLAGTLALGACWSMAPDYERPKSPVADQFNGVPAAGTESKIDAKHAAFLGWKNFYNDDALKNLLALGLQNNRDLRVSILNIEKVEAAYRINRSALFPSVDGSASLTRSRTPETVSYTQRREIGNSTSAIGLISYELDIWGRIHSLNQAAWEQYLQMADVERSVRITISSSIALQYYSWTLACEQLAIAEQMLALSKDYRDKVSNNYNEGLVSELDFAQADAQYQSTRDSVEQLKAAKDQAFNALQVLVGCDLPTDLVPEKSLMEAGLVTELPAGLPSELLLTRPDILAAEHALKSANANIGAARAAFFPSVTLTANAGWMSTDPNELLHRNARTWSIGPSVNVPIFNGGRLAAELDVAKLEREIEVANYEKAIQTAFQEVSDELAVANTIEQRIAAQNQYLASEKRRYEIVRDNYDSGNASSLEVILAQQEYFGAQQSVLATHFELVANKIRFYKALGGGWTADSFDPTADPHAKNAEPLNPEPVPAAEPVPAESTVPAADPEPQNLVPVACEAMAQDSLEDYE